MGRFNEFIKEKSSGLNLAAQSRKVDKNRDWLARIAREENYLPKKNTLVDISHLLEIEIDELIDRYLEDWEEKNGGFPNPLAEWYFRQLLKNGLNFTDVEKKTGVSHGTQSRWVRGKRFPPIPILDKAIAAFDVEYGEAKQTFTLSRYNQNELDHPNLFGSWVKEIRGNDLVQKEVARDALNHNFPIHISQIERGIKTPRLSTALKLIRFFDGDEVELMKKVLIDRAARNQIDIILREPGPGSVKIAICRAERNLLQKELAADLSVGNVAPTLLEYSSFHPQFSLTHLRKIIRRFSRYFGLNQKRLLVDFDLFLERFLERKRIEKELRERESIIKLKKYDQEFKNRTKENQILSGRQIYRKMIGGGISYRELEKKADQEITHEAIRKFKTGEILPAWKKTKRLGKALDMDSIELLVLKDLHNADKERRKSIK